MKRGSTVDDRQKFLAIVILALSLPAIGEISSSQTRTDKAGDYSDRFNFLKYAEASSEATTAQLGPKSTAMIEAEAMGELVIAIQEGDLPDGFYDVVFTCEDPLNVSQTYSGLVEVLKGYGSTEVYLNLDDGRYADCRVHVGSLEAQLPPIVITQNAGLGGWEYLDRVISLLDKAVEEYQIGNSSGARNLVIEAYNSNFDLIERDIIEDDSDLKEKLEKEISEELLNKIHEGVPALEFEARVSEINAELISARTIITPEFSEVAIGLIMIVGFGSAVAFLPIWRKCFSS